MVLSPSGTLVMEVCRIVWTRVRVTSSPRTVVTRVSCCVCVTNSGMGWLMVRTSVRVTSTGIMSVCVRVFVTTLTPETKRVVVMVIVLVMAALVMVLVTAPPLNTVEVTVVKLVWNCVCTPPVVWNTVVDTTCVWMKVEVLTTVLPWLTVDRLTEVTMRVSYTIEVTGGHVW